MRTVVPVLTVIAAILVLWYAGAFLMNRAWTMDQAARAGSEPGFSEVLRDTMNQERARLPAPHQVAQELYDGTFEKKVTSKRSLVYHGFITFQATMAGFALGIVFGVALAVALVLSRVMDLMLMPWAIISQTIPVVALAPMIVVLTNAMGADSLMVPKSIIAGYLSFFPVLVSMVAGLRSPSQSQLDLMRTYGATRGQVFWKLRLPASMPYLFASMKIAIAASLVGAIVGELPTGAVAGLGARLLAGSYYGQTVQIWSALFGAAILAAVLVGLLGLLERLTLRRMGMAA